MKHKPCHFDIDKGPDNMSFVKKQTLCHNVGQAPSAHSLIHFTQP